MEAENKVQQKTMWRCWRGHVHDACDMDIDTFTLCLTCHEATIPMLPEPTICPTCGRSDEDYSKRVG
jgi:hypothetical protein